MSLSASLIARQFENRVKSYFPLRDVDATRLRAAESVLAIELDLNKRILHFPSGCRSATRHRSDERHPHIPRRFSRRTGIVQEISRP